MFQRSNPDHAQRRVRRWVPPLPVTATLLVAVVLPLLVMYNAGVFGGGPSATKVHDALHFMFPIATPECHQSGSDDRSFQCGQTNCYVTLKVEGNEAMSPQQWDAYVGADIYDCSPRGCVAVRGGRMHVVDGADCASKPWFPPAIGGF